MGEQRRLCTTIESRQRISEIVLALRQPCVPALMPHLDSLSRDAFPQARSLSRKGWRAQPNLNAAPGRSKPVKGRQHEVVRHCLERDGRIFGQRIPQCQRTVRRQFNDEPISQRPCRVFIILLGFAHDTRNDLRLRHALLLDEKFQCAITPTARWHLEHAGFVTLSIEYSPDI